MRGTPSLSNRLQPPELTTQVGPRPCCIFNTWHIVRSVLNIHYDTPASQPSTNGRTDAYSTRPRAIPVPAAIRYPAVDGAEASDTKMHANALSAQEIDFLVLGFSFLLSNTFVHKELESSNTRFNASCRFRSWRKSNARKQTVFCLRRLAPSNCSFVDKKMAVVIYFSNFHEIQM